MRRGFLPGLFCCRYGWASHMRVGVLGEATFLLLAGLLDPLSGVADLSSPCA